MAGSPLAPHWTVLLFGGLQLKQGDRTIARFATRKTGALLAYLAFHRDQPISREVIAEILWPETPLEAQRNSLRVALNSLRKQLETPELPADLLIHSDRSSLWLAQGAFQTDVHRFERAARAALRVQDPTERREALAEALKHYRGPLLEGWYEDWITPERERLSDLAETARVQLEKLGGALPTLPEADAPAVPTSSVPTPLTRFVGRSAEQAALLETLDAGGRLLTLIGTGGSGKTRLALEIARQRETAGAQRVIFVPLADTDQRNLLAALAHALNLSRPTEVPSLLRIRQELAREPTLLVLDNAETLHEALADFLGENLPFLPALQCLVTSRLQLDLAGEKVFPVAPLSPEAALELFIDRAQAVRPDFQRTSRNQEALIALVERLEGWPLALELAATWAHVLSPAQMLEQLEQRFEWLTTTRRNLPVRHRSLRAVLEASLVLLSEEAKDWFAGLSLFCGSWHLEEAQGVFGVPLSTALRALGELQRSSLIQSFVQDDGTLRYTQQETLHAFAAESLSAERSVALRGNFIRFYTERAVAARRAWDGPGYAQVRRQLENERDNLIQATRLALTLHDPTSAVELARALWPFWLASGQSGLGAALLRTLLPHAPEPELWHGLGRLAAVEGALSEAADALREAIRGFERRGDTLAAQRAQLSLLLLEGKALEALPSSPTPQDPITATYLELGQLSLHQGDIPAFRALLEEALLHSQGSPDQALVEHHLALLPTFLENAA